MVRVKTRKKKRRYGQSVARIYEIPASLVGRVDKAASSGEDMAVFVATFFGHMIAKTTDGIPAIKPDIAQRLAAGTIGSVLAVGVADAAKSFVAGGRAAITGQPVAEPTPQTVMESIGLGDAEIKEAAMVLGTGVRVFYDGVSKGMSKEAAIKATQTFIAEALANKVFAEA